MNDNRTIYMFNMLGNTLPFDEVKNTISDLVIADFVKKSLLILDSTVIVPCTLYTYDIFKNMFGFKQTGDCTSDSSTTENFNITDCQKIVDLIVDGLITEMPNLKEQEDRLKVEVRRMYGPGEFPFLCVRAKQDRGAWWFSYTITR